MLKHLLVLPDGSEIFSGGNGAAVVQVTLTRSVNEGQQLRPGSACAAMLEATLLEVDPGRIAAGDALTLYTVDESGQRKQEGIFLAEKPERTGAHTLKLTAYDRLTLLDRDMTDWLSGLTGWPYTLHTLAQMVCQTCGLTLATEEIPNGDFPVEKFAADGVTGRQLMMWIGQAACRFCRATPAGEVELTWYTPATVGVGPSPVFMAEATYADTALSLRAADAAVTDDVAVESVYMTATDDGAGNVTLTLSDCLQRQYCIQGGMTLADYAVAPVEKVQLRQEEGDVGTLWPGDTAELKNTYTVTGNPLLTAVTAQSLQPVAQTLYEQLKDVTYTPGTLKLPAGQPIGPGSILQVTDPAGNTTAFYVMTAERSGQLDTLTCAGEAERDSTGSFNDLSYSPLSGKVLRLKADVEGIRTAVERQQTQGDSLRTQLTALEQTAESISATVQSITENGTDKLTNQFGLTIDGSCVAIHRTGVDMTNRLDEKGMSVVRDAGADTETTMLKADADGVVATDVTVRNYLMLGNHARFEDYTDGADSKRTACFWIGG